MVTGDLELKTSQHETIRNHPSFELRSYWPIPDMTGWRLSNRLGKQSSGNLKRRETGSILFQLEPDMCTKLTFHVTIHSIISTDVPKLLGGLTPWKLALLFCGWTPWRISSEHYPNLLFFWLCLLIQLIQFFPPKFKTHAQLFYPSQNWVPKIIGWSKTCGPPGFWFWPGPHGRANMV